MILNNWLLSVQQASGSRLTPTALYMWGSNPNGQLGDGTTLNDEIPTKLGLESWIQISTGASHTVGRLSNNRIYAWGLNSGGQLGDGTTISKSSPVLIGTLAWSDISAAKNGSHTVGILANGAMFAWGVNTNGQLGINVNTNRSSPIQVGTSSWIAASAGSLHTMAILSDSSVWIWGSAQVMGDRALLGSTDTSSPVQISAAGSSYTAIDSGIAHALALDTTGRMWTIGTVGTPGNYWSDAAVGNEHVTALRSDGRLFTWGNNTVAASLGDGTTINKSSPVPIGTSSWAAVAAAGFTSYAIRSDGALFAWGDGSGGQIGDGVTARNMFDTGAPSNFSTGYSWSKISGGANTFLAATSDGTLWGWGDNSFGQLGIGTTVLSNLPIKIGPFINSASPPTFIDFSAGNFHSAAITSNGALYTWGFNNNGQIGDGTTVNKSSPVKIGSLSWSKIATGSACTLAIDSSSQLFAWGATPVGDNSTVARSSPVKIGTNQASSWVAITAGNSFRGAISNLGHLYVWGSQSVGELGSGTAGNAVVPLDPLSWTQIATGGDAQSMYGLAANGTMYVWGSASSGGLGNGTTTPSVSSPTQLAAFAGLSFIKISGAINTTGPAGAGILTDGRLYTWGIGTNGLGARGTTVSASNPTQVTGSWVTIESNQFSQAAFKTGNTLFTWGDNGFGQMGDGTTINKSSPVQIGSSSWTQIAVTSGAMAGIRADGALFTWGIASRLGDGTTANRSSPVQVGTDSWSMISGSASGHFAAIRSDGALFTWGSNGFGELGDGTTVSQSSMIQIGSSSWSFVGARNRVTIGKLVGESANLYTWGSDFRSTVDTTRSSPTLLQGYSDYVTTTSPYVTIPTVVLAINANSHLLAWGNNTSGQLGTANSGAGTHSSTPRRVLTYGATAGQIRYYPHLLGADGAEPWNIPGVTAGLSSWSIISTGANHSAGITQDGALFLWGLNTAGQLGDGTTANRSSPVKLGSSSWVMVDCLGAVGSATAAIRSSDRALFTWGQNTLGQLGDGTTVSKSSPVQIGLSSWGMIGGAFTVLAGSLTSLSGNLYAWGAGANGARAGISTSTNVSSPVQVGLLSYRLSPVQVGTESWTTISAGLSYAVGKLANGQVYGWGLGTSGQLGDGTTVSKSSPVFASITSGISWADLTAAEVTSYGRAANGAIYSWGGGALGQLGDGTTVTKSTLVKIGAESWTQLKAGGSHVIGVLANGKIAAWGLNIRGQLGDGTTLNKSSPVVIGASSWSFATAGVNTAMAISTDGALWSWGDNQYGQLAQGSTISRSSPVQVGTLFTWWRAALSDTGPFGTAIMISKSGTLLSAGYNNTGAMGDGTTT